MKEKLASPEAFLYRIFFSRTFTWSSLTAEATVQLPPNFIAKESKKESASDQVSTENNITCLIQCPNRVSEFSPFS